MNSVHELLEADRLEAIAHQHELEERGRPDPVRAGGCRRRGGEGVNTPPTEQRPEGEHEVRRGSPSATTGKADPARASRRHRRHRRAAERRISWQKLTFLPALLIALLLATWLWFEQADLDPISENALSNGQVSKALWQHIQLTVISTFFVLIIAIPLGILLTRKAFRKATPIAMTIANMGQATPAIGLLALLVIWLGTGEKSALIGITIYAILPVLSNTIAGLKANDPTLLEASRGIGMSPLGVLTRVELPAGGPADPRGRAHGTGAERGHRDPRHLRRRRRTGRPDHHRHHHAAHAGPGPRLDPHGGPRSAGRLAGVPGGTPAEAARTGGGDMSGPTRRTRTLAAFAGLLVLASGCGLTSGSPMTDDVSPGTVGKGEPLKGATLTVASKEFTEQLVLGAIMGIAFQAAGAKVIDRTGIQGSIGTREAIKNGDADATYEYTGTAWITYLGNSKPIPDPQKQWQAVHDADPKNGVIWLPPSRPQQHLRARHEPGQLQEVRHEDAVRRGRPVEVGPDAVTLCVESEFANRADGLPGMEKAYGMSIPAKNITQMDTGIIYTQVKKGSCTYGEVFTTDGRIKSMNLAVMEDDRKFFPNYNAAPGDQREDLQEVPADRPGHRPGDRRPEQLGGPGPERQGGRPGPGPARGGPGLDDLGRVREADSKGRSAGGRSSIRACASTTHCSGTPTRPYAGRPTCTCTRSRPSTPVSCRPGWARARAWPEEWNRASDMSDCDATADARAGP